MYNLSEEKQINIWNNVKVSPKRLCPEIEKTKRILKCYYPGNSLNNIFKGNKTVNLVVNVCPKRRKTRNGVKRYYFKSYFNFEGGFFENIFKQSTNRWFNMSYIPNPNRSEDFSGMPIIEEPDDVRTNENALVNLAKAPLYLIANKGPQAANFFLGNGWKSILISQSVNAASLMLAKQYGYENSTALNLISAIVLRYTAGTLCLNPFVSLPKFIYTIYDCYKLGYYTAQKVQDFNDFKKTSSTWAWLSWGGSKIGNFFFKTTPALKNTSRISGGDFSSQAMDSSNQIAILKQVMINNQPKQFTPENFEILKSFQSKLTNNNFNVLADKLSYKSTFTDKLGQRYMNMTTDVHQLVKNPVLKQSTDNVSQQVSNNVLNTTNPKLIGEYTNNIQGKDAITLAENMVKNQRPTSNISPNIIQDTEPAIEVARELSWGGKFVITALGILTVIIGYKILNNKYPEYINLDWFNSLKDKIYNFIYSPKATIVDVSNDEINSSVIQTLNNENTSSEIVTNNQNVSVETLNNDSVSSLNNRSIEAINNEGTSSLNNDEFDNLSDIVSINIDSNNQEVNVNNLNPPSYDETIQNTQYFAIPNNPNVIVSVPIVPFNNNAQFIIPLNNNSQQIISSNEVREFGRNLFDSFNN